jgi:hypothetical protein
MQSASGATANHCDRSSPGPATYDAHRLGRALSVYEPKYSGRMVRGARLRPPSRHGREEAAGRGKEDRLSLA